MSKDKEIIKNMQEKDKDKMLYDIFKVYMKSNAELSDKDKIDKIKYILSPIAGNAIFDHPKK